MLYLITDPVVDTSAVKVIIIINTEDGEKLLQPIPVGDGNIMKGLKQVIIRNFYRYRDDQGNVHQFEPEDIKLIQIGDVILNNRLVRSVLDDDPDVVRIHTEQLQYRQFPLTRIDDDDVEEMAARGIHPYDQPQWEALIEHFRQIPIPDDAFFRPTSEPLISSLDMMETLQLLTNNNEFKVIIAGGAIISLMMHQPVDDYDCYFVSDSEYYRYLQWIVDTFTVTKFVVTDSTVTVTIVHNDQTYKIQLINREYESPANVIVGFDLPASAVMYYDNHIWISDRARMVLEKGYMWVDPTVVSNNYGVRLMKYGMIKGIPTVIPGFNPRDWLAQHPDHKINWLLQRQVKPSELGVLLNNLGFLIYIDSYYHHHPLSRLPSDYHQFVHDEDEQPINLDSFTVTITFQEIEQSRPLILPGDTIVYTKGMKDRDKEIKTNIYLTKQRKNTRYGYYGYYDSSNLPQTLDIVSMNSYDLIPHKKYNELAKTLVLQ